METKDYRTTKKAGAWVAGMRNPGEGKILKLTAEQARHALIAKEIVEVEPQAEPKPAPEAPALPAPAKSRKQD